MSITEPQDPPGAVELREDAPLRAGAGTRCCATGPRAIAGAFAALTAGITVALLTQIYYGDYEVVPHGSVSSSAAACSRAGAASLRAGGRAADAAATAALCLAVLTPHRTSLDASGSLVYWEYRSSRTQPPTALEWGGAGEGDGKGGVAGGARPPRLLVALAALHSRWGALPWASLLQPAIDLARGGYVVSESMAAVAAARGVAGFLTAALRTEPAIADYLETLLHNTSSDHNIGSPERYHPSNIIEPKNIEHRSRAAKRPSSVPARCSMKPYIWEMGLNSCVALATRFGIELVLIVSGA